MELGIFRAENGELIIIRLFWFYLYFKLNRRNGLNVLWIKKIPIPQLYMKGYPCTGHKNDNFTHSSWSWAASCSPRPSATLPTLSNKSIRSTQPQSPSTSASAILNTTEVNLFAQDAGDMRVDRLNKKHQRLIFISSILRSAAFPASADRSKLLIPHCLYTFYLYFLYLLW